MAALGLAGKNTFDRVVLVNERDEFVERIRLQESVSGPVAHRMPSLTQFLAGTRIEFICGRVEALDAVNRIVRIDSGGTKRELAFDRCIYALGSATDAHSVPGVDQHAYRLDPGEDRRSATALCSRLAESSAPSLRVAVVGGANTATEVAGEIKAHCPQADVTMISRSRAANFRKGSKLEEIARSELERLGVTLVDHQTVTEVRAGEVVTASGRIFPADICVWAAGVHAAPFANLAGLAVDPQGRIFADSTLSSISHPHILAVGDALHPTAPSGARYRMSAFAAIISGAYAAHRILAERRGQKPRPFSFSAYGQGVAIGTGGVGFFTFPDDGDAYFVLRGPLALRIRNVFVAALVFFLKLERRFPGSALFWIGRRRVSWKQVERLEPHDARGSPSWDAASQRK
jgi:NADH dehydrogenase